VIGARARIALAGLGTLALAGCSGLPLREAGAGAARVELADTPFFPQQQYQCGPAALASVLVAAGVATSAEALVPEVYLPARQGSLQAELLGAARRHDRLPYVIDPEPAALIAQLDDGRPVLVLQNFGSARSPAWHYAVVIGYERDAERFILRTGTTRRQQIAAARFLATWRRADSWGLVALRPGELPAGATAARYLEAASGLEAAGRTAVAASSYAAATARWPQQPLGWFGLANVRLAEGRFVDAEAAYREALALDPAQPAARNNFALLLARRGCVDAAQAEISRAHAAAAGTRFAAEVADTEQDIAALRAVAGPPPADCPR
jgi:tetratricopeptide (TPR) repeat protein